jgi:pimeloyl-ACP methyl ester carboxylesterase
MRRVTVDHLSCLVTGTGPPVVLLHGLAGSAREMTVTLPGHRVIAPDQRGHGLSTRRPDDLSREAYVRDVARVIEALADGGPVTLAGQSMGAHTAMLTAAWHPALVDRLVLLEGGVGGSEDDYPARLGKWFASWPVPFPTAAAAIDFLGPGPLARAWTEDMEQREDGLWPRFDADIMEAAIRPVAETARWAEWQQVRARTLLVRGAQSRIPDEEIARMCALRPEVTLVAIPDSGHDAHLDQPKAWTALLQRFSDGSGFRDSRSPTRAAHDPGRE